MELDDSYWSTEGRALCLDGRAQTAAAFCDEPWPAAAVPWLLESLALARREPAADRHPFVYVLRHVPPSPEVVVALLSEILEGPERPAAVDSLCALPGGSIDRWALSAPLPALRGALPCDLGEVVALVPDGALELFALLAPCAEAARPPLRAVLGSEDLRERELAVRALKPPPETVEVDEILRRLQASDDLERVGALGVHAHGLLPYLGEIAGDGWEEARRRERARLAADAITEDCRRFRPWLLGQLRAAEARGASLAAARLVWTIARMEPRHVQLIGMLRYNRMPALEAARLILASEPAG